MKKIFTAFAFTMAMCTSAMAQKTEVYWLYAMPSISGDFFYGSVGSQNRSFTSMGLGVNRVIPFAKKAPLDFVFGLSFQFAQSGERESFSSNFSKFQLPLSVMYVLKGGKDVEFNPYVGFDATYYTSGKSEKVSFGHKRIEWFPDCNDWTVGYHVGACVALRGVVLGFEYQHDFSNFYRDKRDGVKIRQTWDCVELSLGYRF